MSSAEPTDRDASAASDASDASDASNTPAVPEAPPKAIPVSRICCSVRQEVAAAVIARLGELGVADLYTYPARTVQLRATIRGPVPIRWRRDLVEVPVEVFRALVTRRNESQVLRALIETAELDQPGHGTVTAERIDLMHRDDAAPHRERRRALADISLPERLRPRVLGGLVGVICIVQRGVGNEVSRIALEMGTSVPVVSNGTGTGLRDKLGLLRVTIPAEKDVVELVTARTDADGVLATLVNRARLHQPGRGFVALYPIHHGLPNTRVSVGRGDYHAARIDQIVTAIDELHGTPLWRRRFSGDARQPDAPLQSDYLDLTMISNAGTTQDLLRAAMAAGAGGATTANLRWVPLTEDASTHGIAARERTNLVVARSQLKPITAALAGAGLFGDEAAGHIEISQCPKVFTYTARNRTA